MSEEDNLSVRRNGEDEMSKYPNKIPFDLEKLKAGYQAVTYDDRLVIEFHHFEKAIKFNPLHVVLECGGWQCYETNGIASEDEESLNLFLLPKTKTYYIGIYYSKINGYVSTRPREDKKDLAKEFNSDCILIKIIKTELPE
jgi:hypothetical protein